MKPARVAIALSLLYIASNGVWTRMQAARMAETLPNLECAEDEGDCQFTVIASPPPFYPWQREMIVDFPPAWKIAKAGALNDLASLKPVSDRLCAWPNGEELASGGSQSEAFLFWSRAPFAERAEDGSVLLRDARFYDPRARDRFTVALPDVECVPLDAEPMDE